MFIYNVSVLKGVSRHKALECKRKLIIVRLVLVTLFTLVTFGLAMFSDSVTQVVGFDSSPPSKKSFNDNSSETVVTHTATQGTQTTGSTSSAVQASPNVDKDPPPYDADKLLLFLKRVMPDLKKELKNMDGLNLNKDMEKDEPMADEATKQIIIEPENSKNKIISSLSWNCTQKMLAVGYSETHNGWCRHETSVMVYNTEKTQFEKQPEQVLNVSACVSCLGFNQTHSFLLAVGLHNGDVIIWDSKHYEGIFEAKKKGAGDKPAHEDVITTVTWRGNSLVTAGRDGRIIWWTYHVENHTFEVFKRYIILQKHLMPGAESSEFLEILHMEFTPESGMELLVAASGGAIFFCSLERSSKEFPANSAYEDPVLITYKPRKGIVTSVSCKEDFFASSGTDFEIHVFKYAQKTPVLKIDTSCALLGVSWFSPDALVCWSESQVFFQDVFSKAVVPVCDVSGISSAAFKKGRKTSLAIGDRRGAITILTDLRKG